MGKARTAQWYDERWSNNERYQRPTEECPHYPLWCEVAKRVPGKVDVVDLGCGNGHLALLLRPKVRRYLGLDFSVVALRQARRRANPMRFRAWRAGDKFPTDWECYVACEFLEHVEDDLGVLEAIQPGRKIILSVPTFDSKGHVRWFTGADEARERYEPVIEFSELVPLDDWFIGAGWRQ